MSGHVQRGFSVPGATGSRLVMAITVAAALTLGQGCRTSENDVHRWANTLNGPRKLVAVLTHDKYPLALRLEAAETLITMKPRGGRSVGIQGTEEQEGLIDALSQMPPTERSALISKLLPKLEEEMAKPPPATSPGQSAPSDPSIPFKDTAFALLTHEDGALMPNEAAKQSIRAALAQWCGTNFSARLDDSSQLYGVEQMLRVLKADGVRRIPDMMLPGAKLDRMSDLIAELGDPETKLRASQKLVEIAKDVSSDKWLQQKRPGVEAANKASKLNPNAEQLQQQLTQYQEEELLRVFGSMKKIGGKPVVDYLLEYMEDPHGIEKRRAAALAALQGNLDRNSAAQAQAVLNIAGAEATPDSVRDVALQRVGEFPRAVVVEKLYELFKSANWKVRWVAASLVLKMSNTSQVPEFMSKLGQAEGLAITEPLSYGGLLADMKGPPAPAELAEKYSATSNPVPARLTALGYYYSNGTTADLPKVEAYGKDSTATPKCKADAKECEWKCTVRGASGDEVKDIKTVGEFVEFCVKPAMQKRAAKTGSK